jgi:Tfp pilus assembly protein PilF
MAALEDAGDAQYQRALGLLGLARAAEARAALTKALEADPDHVGAAALRRTLAVPAAVRPGARATRPTAEATRPVVEAPEPKR